MTKADHKRAEERVTHWSKRPAEPPTSLNEPEFSEVQEARSKRDYAKAAAIIFAYQLAHSDDE